MYKPISILLAFGEGFGFPLLTELCGKFGYRCYIASNGRELIETARRERPDLIVSSLGLSDIAGSVSTEWLKADPATAGIPVILVAGPGRAEDRVRGLAAGADYLLTEPCTTEQLLETVHLFIG